ncbi:hypothetical protein MKF36_05965 [Bacillus velezensis]|nr:MULTISPECIES: hypothetical protein [Bacillus amyloliquefaciens group]UMQ52294.1 hypothetical protein MKF36_05965 [Bacillus velezensis]
MKQKKKKPNKNAQERSERFWLQMMGQETCKGLKEAKAAHLNANKGRNQNAGFNH